MSVFKEAVPFHSSIDKAVCARWHLELPASDWHSSDLSAVLGQMALGRGGAFSRVSGLQL